MQNELQRNRGLKCNGGKLGMRRGSAGEGRGITAFGNSVHRAAVDESKKRKQVGEHHEGSFGVYMAHKIQKLRNQNASFIGSAHEATDATAGRITHHHLPSHHADAARLDGSVEDGTPRGFDDNSSGVVGASSASATSTSRLFEGVHVFVDGYTVPSKEDIRSLMLLHGGGFEHYETSRVTHIVATHLATSKLQQLRKMRRPTPVVHPDWIVKSIEANYLLPLQPFLYKGFADPTQASVSSSLSLSGSTKSQTQSPRLSDSSRRPHSVQDGGMSEEKSSDDVVDDDEAAHHGFSESEGASDEEDHEAILSQYAASKQCQDSPSSSVATTNPPLNVPTRTNSTRDRPSLVRHFFAKSRLHHIGSWRTTFQQRAGEFLSRYKGEPFRRAPPTSADRVILHVDMDCFFVAVAVRDKPQFQNVPVAIAHSSNAGSSEISSCNYLAREKGLRAGMFMQSAKTLCPELVVLPYKFEEIEACSFQIYDIFFSRTPFVQAMSCDEAYLEFNQDTDGVTMAEEIRQAIFASTRCTASVGVSYNILLAKLATRQAKPNGVFQIASPQEAEPFLQSLKIKELPGVGHRMDAKMDELGLEDIEQLRAVSKTELQVQFGKTTSEMLYNYARGVDHRPLSVESNMMRKSVSAVVNFGIRFQNANDASEFMMALAEELSTRLKNLHVRTKCLTLLIKKRRAGAPVEPSKFMGMGICDSFSKSQLLSDATDSDLVIGRTSTDLLRQFNFPVEDLRGVGIQATKLVSTLKQNETKAGQLFKAWLADADRPSGDVDMLHKHQEKADLPVPAPSSPPYSHLNGTLSQINMDVLDELPKAIREEVLSSYRPHGDQTHKQASAVLRLPPPPPRVLGRLKQGGGGTARQLFTNPTREDRSTPGTIDALNDIRMSQIDEEVYHALPLAIRKEINIYTKRSKTSTIPKPVAKRSASNNDPVQAPEKVELQSIEILVDALSSTVVNCDTGFDADEPSVHAAFDAIFSRLLVEVEARALDQILRKLRFVRRKCHQLFTSVPDSSKRLLCTCFNTLLQHINRELRQTYGGVFPGHLVAPLSCSLKLLS